MILDWIQLYFLLFLILSLIAQWRNRKGFGEIGSNVLLEVPVFGRMLDFW